MSQDKKNTKDVNDEVEELLRAAEDAALLKINLNSHTVHASPSDLHPDLEQRFRDLKMGSKSKTKKESVTRKTPPPQSAEVNKEIEEDELLARFAALKASLPKPSPSASSSFVGVETSDVSVEDKLAGGSLEGKAIIDNEEEDEVEKVIRWAMDAVRLDPSPSSDDEELEDDTQDDDSDDNETSDEDVESSKKKPKGKCK
ncbi:histone acetyltransferase KAT6A-like [Chenopodium quinoa]|uniref:histone acetyltransferase KAT6A-like n=1 Tax=Chenopodium quinoa TaxID=63459 RepID=UPI000B78D182|nr:histone acetyltransferase KAT6A-like [Chenopodium quinoa]XP_021724426.1 histone acetyltransferase KAT6A-like [Chenopodium quinoa]XP_021724427.1 histone acetyltransferase KAT6A-like [Chenopodium quinoa]